MPYSWVDRSLLAAIKNMAAPVPIRIELASRTARAGEAKSAPLQSRNGSPALPLIRLKDTRALFALVRNPAINFGDLYSSGDLEVEGDLVGLLEQLYQIPQKPLRQLAARWVGWMQGNSLRGSRKNIHHHYDISNEFYQWWLDRELVYTCAYFPHENATLEEAQRAKMDLVSRKLWLRPEEKVVEAGCGWGALALHMARHYGVRVRAFNISHEQIAYARERAQREGLASRVEFIEDDYRNISGKVDVFVSVGMLEHVGREHYHEIGRVIRRVIGSEGRGLLHFIGKDRPAPLSAWIRKRIFPGGYTPALREAMAVLEPFDFSVLDVENLRRHYAKTIEHWLERFERSYNQVVERFDENFARMWRLYLAGSIAAFRVGTLQLFQVVFAGKTCQGIPWTREHLYREMPERDEEWIPAMS
jgi:cyclopropane-fatty-acyl-phospholipid synthase